MLPRLMNQMVSFDELRREFDRVLEGFVRGADTGPWLRPRAYPAVNVWEDQDRLYLEAEAPGMTMKDVEIQIIGNELSIKGSRTPMEGDNLTYHRQERGAGEFARFVTLPVEVNADKVEGVLKDGILTVTMPKAEKARARKIAVQSK